MNIRLLLILAASSVAACAAPSVSVHAFADYYAPSGSVAIGDVGTTLSTTVARFSPAVAMDLDFARGLSLELGYRHTPALTAHKQAPTASIFPTPPGTSTTQVVTPYDLSLRRDDVFVGALYSVRLGRSLAFSAGVLASLGMSRTGLRVTTPVIQVPNGSGAPGALVGAESVRRSATVRGGATVRLAYALGGGLDAQAELTYLDSAMVRGTYSGAGLSYRF